MVDYSDDLHVRVGYGMSFWTSPNGKYNGWRLSIALQYIPASLFCVGVLFMPET
jgi:hypothetical protein